MAESFGKGYTLWEKEKIAYKDQFLLFPQCFQKTCKNKGLFGEEVTLWQKVLQTGRKHCVKRRNCSLQAISPFPTVFSKDLHNRHVKTRACLGKG